MIYVFFIIFSMFPFTPPICTTRSDCTHELWINFCGRTWRCLWKRLRETGLGLQKLSKNITRIKVIILFFIFQQFTKIIFCKYLPLQKKERIVPLVILTLIFSYFQTLYLIRSMERLIERLTRGRGSSPARNCKYYDNLLFL